MVAPVWEVVDAIEEITGGVVSVICVAGVVYDDPPPLIAIQEITPLVEIGTCEALQGDDEKIDETNVGVQRRLEGQTNAVFACPWFCDCDTEVNEALVIGPKYPTAGVMWFACWNLMRADCVAEPK
jgi:hypothetical protein